MYSIVLCMIPYDTCSMRIYYVRLVDLLTIPHSMTYLQLYILLLRTYQLWENAYCCTCTCGTTRQHKSIKHTQGAPPLSLHTPSHSAAVHTAASTKGPHAIQIPRQHNSIEHTQCSAAVLAHTSTPCCRPYSSIHQRPTHDTNTVSLRCPPGPFAECWLID